MVYVNRGIGALRRIAPLAVLAAVAIAPPAHAAGEWTCGAGALRATVLEAVTADPLRANRTGPACRADTASIDTPTLPPGLSASTLRAHTTMAAPEYTAGAFAEVADLRVGGLGDLTLPAPDLGPHSVLDVAVLGLGTIRVDLRPALQALLEPLPGLDLLRVRAVRAEAAGSCVNGAPRLSGSSSIVGLAIGGRDVALNGPVTETLELIDTQSIDPSDIDLAKVVLPLGIDISVVRAALQPVLDGLPDIEVPPTLARVRVVPERQIAAAGTLTQRALEAHVSVGGVQVLELVAGEATVGAGDVRCPAPVVDPPPTDPPPAPTRARGSRGTSPVAVLALQCTDRRVVLIDVLRVGRRVRFRGVADPSYAGRRVSIRLTANGRTVARPKLREDGVFRASAPLPPRKIRFGNRARYQASIGKQRSLRLKLARRMRVTRAHTADGRVTLTGRLTGPLPRRTRPIVVKRRVSCGEWKVVDRFRPRRNGRFRVTLDGGEAGSAAVFRLRTRVTARTARRALAPTFTLPRYVQF